MLLLLSVFLFCFLLLFCLYLVFFGCCFVFPCMSLWCTLFLARFCHSRGVKAAHSEFWIILAWSILKCGHNLITPPQLQSLPEAGNSIDIRFCCVAGRYYGLLYCNLVASTPNWEGRRAQTFVKHAPCPGTWWKDTPCHLASVGLLSGLHRDAGCLQLPMAATQDLGVGKTCGTTLAATAPGGLRQKRSAGSEESFSFSTQQSNWIAHEQKLVSRMKVTGCWS